MLELLRRVRLRLSGVRVSRSVRVGAGVRIELAAGGSIVLHPGAVLGAGARISALGGRVVVGPGGRLGERAVVVSRASVVIGAHAVVGDWAMVSDEPQPGLPLSGPIVVADFAVIGPHAAVSSSVAAGEEIAPYAVV